MKRLHLVGYLLLAIAAKSYAIEADNPVSCRHQIDELKPIAGDHSTKASSAIDLLVWNVQKFENPSTLPWLQKTTAQIILTQESIASIQEAFARTLDANQAFSPGYRTLGNETSGVGIITKLQTSLTCAWQHQEPWLLTPKATLVSALPLANEVLIAVNLHAINFSIGTQELQQQIEAISDVIDQYDGPIVVAGDFNTWSKARTLVLERFIAQHDLHAANFDPDHRVRPFAYPLDHILTKNLNVLTTRSEETDLSDHTPLMVTITPSSALGRQLAHNDPTEIERPLSKR